MNCALCGSKDLRKVIDLGYHPCADTFVSKLPEVERRFPLEVMLCSCGHTQLSHIVPGSVRYQETDYSYDSSNSPVSIRHFNELAASVPIATGDLICDVGSNIGTLLGAFKDRGCRVIGIDPSSNITRLANEEGIPTINDFFGMEAAEQVLRIGQPNVITATNVLNHSEDVSGFLDVVEKLLHPEGCLVVEVPYLLEMVRQTAFDTIYLEHVNYFSVMPLSRFLFRRGFGIERVEVNDYMCGTLRLFIRRGVHGNLDKYSDLESDLSSMGTYKAFMERVRDLKFRLNTELYDIKAKGGRIIGIGAATKGNTLMNYCGIDSDILDYVTDASSLKIGKFTPGSHIPIVSDESIKDATHGLILPWNIAGHLTRKLQHLGLKFIVPLLK